MVSGPISGDFIFATVVTLPVILERVEGVARGIFWRIVGSIVIVTGFLVGSLIYVGFYTAGYSLGQRIVVVLVAFIIAIAALSIMWLTWAQRRGWFPRQWTNR
jgi:hypothetical protein